MWHLHWTLPIIYDTLYSTMTLKEAQGSKFTSNFGYKLIKCWKLLTPVNLKSVSIYICDLHYILYPD